MRKEQGSSISFPIGPLRMPIEEQAFIGRIVSLEQGIYRGIDIRFEPLAREAIIEDVQQGYFPVIYLNHSSHYDGRPLAKSAERILKYINSFLLEEKKYRGFALPIATSIGTGNQHSLIKGLFESNIAREIEQAGIVTVSYARDKDREQYGDPPNLLEFMRKMKNLIKQGYAIAFFPEATVEGGRRNGKHGIKGMQPFGKNAISTMARLALHEGHVPTFIPIGIWGTHNVFSPDNYMPTIPTLIRAPIPFLAKGIVKVRIGVPIRWDDLETMLGTSFNEGSVSNFLAGQLASLIPERARGVYKDVR